MASPQGINKIAEVWLPALLVPREAENARPPRTIWGEERKEQKNLSGPKSRLDNTAILFLISGHFSFLGTHLNCISLLYFCVESND